jgi:hypothetical protein
LRGETGMAVVSDFHIPIWSQMFTKSICGKYPPSRAGGQSLGASGPVLPFAANAACKNHQKHAENGDIWEQGFSIESGPPLNRGFCEEFQGDKMGLFTLAPSGFKEAAQDAEVFQPFVGTGALDNPAHGHHRAQTTLRLIVGRRDVGCNGVVVGVWMRRGRVGYFKV